MNRKTFINLIPIQCIRRNLRKEWNEEHDYRLEITSDTKILMVAPHADDELIGAGGVMSQYPQNFDVLCVGSSGIAYKNITAKQRSDIRINEFNSIMKILSVQNHWIFETYGENVKIDQIKGHFNQYLKVIDTKKYDYIFLPVPHDRHPEHSFITNNLIKKIIKKNGRKSSLKIVFYEVWSLIPNPNVFVDITNCIDKKTELLKQYKSQHVWINYAEKSRHLNAYRGMQNNNADYSEAFFVTSARKYLKKGYRLPLC
jgi:LmbE family N-acetylglucosaminyl deacetylase